MALDVSYLTDPFWESFQLWSIGGLIYAQYNLPVPTVDLTQWVKDYTVTESIRDVSRVLDVTLDVDDNFPDVWRVHAGSHLALFGNTIDPTTGGVRQGLLYTGQVYTAGRSEKPDTSQRVFRAYDVLTVLARTEDTLVFTNNTMTDIVRWCCGLYGFNMGTIVDTEVQVGQIIQGPGVSVAQVIEEAAQRTLRRSGRKFFVRITNDNSALELLELGQTGVQWELGSGMDSVVLDYDEEFSFEDGRTAINLVTEATDGSNRSSVVGTRQNPQDPYMVTFGKLSATISPDNTTNAPTNDQQLDAEYALRNRLVKKAWVRNITLPGARQGDAVHVILPNGQFVAYIATVRTEHTAGEPVQSLELIFDSLGASA